MKKRVALISPKGNIFGKNKELSTFLLESQYMESFKLLWTGPNLALITVASLLPDHWECEYIDENYRTLDFEKPYDLVCISSMTQQSQRAYAIADVFRNKGIFTVMGGIHATVLPEEAAEHVDSVLAGEAETLFPVFIRDYLQGKAKKIYTEHQIGVYDIQKSPMPRFDLLQGYNYPLITVQTTRGCPHDCSFCAASKVFGSHYRRKDHRQIMNEIREVHRLFPDALLLFADDNMFVKRSECKELLRELKDLKLRWIGQTDISIAKDEQLLELMVQAGCQWIVIGFESVSYQSLSNLDDKNWKLSQLPNYSKMIDKIQSYGIGVYGTFIVGLDEDGLDVFKATSDFIIQNHLYGANITVPTPLPGTRLRDTLLEESRVLDYGWSDYTLWDVVIRPNKMTAEELKKGLLSIYLEITNKSVADTRLTNLKKLVKNRIQVLKKLSG